MSRIGDQSGDIFNVQTELGAKPGFDPIALQQLQLNDLKTLADSAKVGKVTFKEPKTETKRAPEPGTILSEGNIYFFHPDHLGTATYLTDINGNPYQFFLNLPFGETMAEQHSLSENYENPFKFNGKELDEETGLYYYGARYYDPRVSVWLGVDPMGEKYPSVNPYNYCLQNPVNLVDPDGKEPFHEYQLNKNGTLTLLNYTNKDYHVIYNHNRTESLSVSLPVLNDVKNYNVPNFIDIISYRPGVNSTFEIKGGNEVKVISEFFYNFFYKNTHVEFSYQLYKTNNDYVAIIGTAYSPDVGGIGGQEEAKRLKAENGNIELLKDHHNHVDYEPIPGLLIDFPSGYTRDGKPVGSRGDRIYYKTMQKILGKQNIPKNFDIDYTDNVDFKIQYNDNNYKRFYEK